MFGQTDIENLFLKRSGVIYYTTNKKKSLPPELINRSRNEYFKKYFTEHRKNAKKVWEGIRCAIEWHKTKSSNITSVTDTSGIKHHDPKSIAAAFANYFKDIPHKCVSKIPQDNINAYNDYLSNPNSNSMVLFDTDEYEIYNIIDTKSTLYILIPARAATISSI